MTNVEPIDPFMPIGEAGDAIVADAATRVVSNEGKPMNDIVQRTETAVTSPVSLTPMEMLSRAVESGAPMDVLERLMSLQERWEKNQARKAFDEAIADAKAEIPPIQRNAKGHNDKRYVDFAAIAKVVDPILSKHGLSYRYRTQQNDRISVTCILSHKAGHSEETTLTGPADTTGNKNAIQAIGSTLTYLQRYSLVQMLGLAAASDDDGYAVGCGVISSEQIATIENLIVETGTSLQRFLSFMKVESVADIPDRHYQRAVDALNAKKAKAS